MIVYPFDARPEERTGTNAACDCEVGPYRVGRPDLDREADFFFLGACTAPPKPQV